MTHCTVLPTSAWCGGGCHKDVNHLFHPLRQSVVVVGMVIMVRRPQQARRCRRRRYDYSLVILALRLLCGLDSTTASQIVTAPVTTREAASPVVAVVIVIVVIIIPTPAVVIMIGVTELLLHQSLVLLDQQ